MKTFMGMFITFMGMFILVALALVIAACAKTPTGTTNDIGDFRVSKLFEHDGCSVYRFYDSGNYRYFTKCEGAVSSTTTYRSGKHKRDDISTGYVE